MIDAPDDYPPTLEISPARGRIDADVTLPGSKSITNRALIIAALADGTSVLEQVLFSDDTFYMADSLSRLGIRVDVDERASRFTVHGEGGRIPARNASLFIGNSGTSARFLTALVALGTGDYEIDGVPRMRQRPIEPLLEALRTLGVDARAQLDNGCLPVTIRAGGITDSTVEMAGDTSSQYFTAMLMVGPVVENGISIGVQGDLVSKPYIDLTIATMRDFGANVESRGYEHFHVPGKQSYSPRTYPIEPDASAASYFFALAAVSNGRVRVLNLGKDSVQGDIEFVSVLERMGCRVHVDDGWTEIHGTEQLRGTDVDMNAISDTMPTLAAIAPFASEPITIRNVEHVRYKETDRIRAVVDELRRLGVRVSERRDGITVYPGKPRRGTVKTYDDHRIAMSFAILGTQVPGIVIDDPGCVAKTFPDFFQRLADAMA